MRLLVDLSRRDLVRGLLRALPLAAVGVGSVVVATRGPHPLAIVWTLTLVASLVGWGGAVRLIVAPTARVDVGLRAIWGVAMTLAIGGVASAMHFANRTFVLSQVAFGLVFLVGELVTGRSRHSAKRVIATWANDVGLVLLVLVALAYALIVNLGLIDGARMQPSDDQPLYLLWTQKLLSTGSMVDSLDVRRLSTFGGQTYLHAEFGAVASLKALFLVDTGVGFLLVLLLIVGLRTSGKRRGGGTAAAVLALITLMTLDSVRINTASLLTGAAAYFGLYRTLQWMRETQPGVLSALSWRRVVLLGGVAATCGVLRTSNVAPAVFFTAIAVVLDHFTHDKSPWSRQRVLTLLRTGAIASTGFLLFMLPWMLALYESTGTLLYPLGKGTMSPGFVFLIGPKSDYEGLYNEIDHFAYAMPVASSLLFVAIGLLPPTNRRHDLLAMTLASVIGTWLVVWTGAGFTTDVTCRYYYAAMVGLALACISSLGEAPAESRYRRWRVVRDALIVGAFVIHASTTREHVRDYLLGWVKVIRDRNATVNPSAEVDEVASGAIVYRDLQSAAEPGAGIAVAVDDPYLFDFKRNPIEGLDLIGGIGPHGYPAFKGPEALASYLQSLGIRYIIYVDFSRSRELYSEGAWHNNLARQDLFLGGEAPFVLDGMQSILALAKTRKHVAEKDALTVLDLATTVPASP